MEQNQNRRRANAPIPQRWGRIPNYRIRPEDRGPQAVDADAYQAVMQRLQAQTDELQNIADNEIWTVMRRQNDFFQELAPRIEYVLMTLADRRDRELALMANEYRAELARLRGLLQNIPLDQLQTAVGRQEQFLTGLNRLINEINLPEEEVDAIYDLLFAPEGEEDDVMMGPPSSPDSPGSPGSSVLTAPPSYATNASNDSNGSNGRNGAGQVMGPYRNQPYNLRPR